MDWHEEITLDLRFHEVLMPGPFHGFICATFLFLLLPANTRRPTDVKRVSYWRPVFAGFAIIYTLLVNRVTDTIRTGWFQDHFTDVEGEGKLSSSGIPVHLQYPIPFATASPAGPQKNRTWRDSQGYNEIVHLMRSIIANLSIRTMMWILTPYQEMINS